MAEVREEILPLAKRHYEEVGHSKSPLTHLDFSEYEAIESLGWLRLYTARDFISRRLQGYATYVVRADGKTGAVQATNTALYMEEEVRGNALSFLSFCESELRADDVRFIFQAVTTKRDFQKVLEFRKYRKHEEVFVKEV